MANITYFHLWAIPLSPCLSEDFKTTARLGLRYLPPLSHPYPLFPTLTRSFPFLPVLTRSYLLLSALSSSSQNDLFCILPLPLK